MRTEFAINVKGGRKMNETYREVSRNLEKVIEDLKKEGIDVRLVGSNVSVCSFPALGFYAVMEKGKVNPETLSLAERAWSPILENMSQDEFSKEMARKVWWTTNGEDSVGDLPTIYDALVDFLERKEWKN
jgi:hypothetical protein